MRGRPDDIVAKINATWSGVGTKSGVDAAFGNDASEVVIKREVDDPFGNDRVVIKSRTHAGFGNDATVGFVRVRRRHLSGSGYRPKAGTSESYDVVRAVRVNGKPRHKFVVGLGSLKSTEACRGWYLAYFWIHAVFRMRRWGGFNEEQRLKIMEDMLRKGAPRPDPEWVTKRRDTARIFDDDAEEVLRWLKGGAA